MTMLKTLVIHLGKTDKRYLINTSSKACEKLIGELLDSYPPGTDFEIKSPKMEDVMPTKPYIYNKSA